MNTTATLLYSAAVFLGGGTITEVIAPDSTWKDLVAGGSVAAVIFVVLVFLKHISATEVRHAEAMKTLADSQAKTSADFSSTVARIATEAREAHETAIKTIVDVLQKRP